VSETTATTDLTIFGTISIGGLIALLEQRPRDESVRFGFGYFAPDSIGSYRGFYDHLAIGYDEGKEATVADLVAKLKEAIGKEFDGYKGGTYRMRADTPVWAANYGDSPSTAIVGIADCDYMTVLQTEWVGV
jgi:hypothetical protein